MVVLYIDTISFCFKAMGLGLYSNVHVSGELILVRGEGGGVEGQGAYNRINSKESASKQGIKHC